MTSEWFLCFQLHIVDESVFANYTCKAFNSLGKMERKISLQKGSKPEKPQVSLHDSTPDSIKINIEGPENEELEIIGYRVQYIKKEELSNSWEHAKQIDIPKGKYLCLNPLFFFYHIENNLAKT